MPRPTILGKARPGGHIFEGPVAAIAIERAGKPLKIFRMAVDTDSALGVSTVAIEGRRPFCIMDYPQIEFAVAVVIEPARGDRPFAAFDSRLCGYIFEAAVAQIVIQHIAIYAGDEQIGTAVVIIVGRGCAHRVPDTRHARFFGDIAELPVT